MSPFESKDHNPAFIVLVRKTSASLFSPVLSPTMVSDLYRFHGYLLREKDLLTDGLLCVTERAAIYIDRWNVYYLLSSRFFLIMDILSSCIYLL